MALGLEVLGAIALTITITRFAGTSGSTTAAAILLAIVTGVSFWSGLWGHIYEFVQSHDADQRLSVEAANAAGGIPLGVNDPFMAFADAKIPLHARVYIDCGPRQASCAGTIDWFGFRLTPRVFVSQPSRAQWAIFYSDNPSDEPFARGWRVLRFAPNFALAEAPR